MISKDEDKLRCWKEYFERMRNRDDFEIEVVIVLLLE